MLGHAGCFVFLKSNGSDCSNFMQIMGSQQNWHRDYDPSIGRYLQSDPIGILRKDISPELKSAIVMGMRIQIPAGDRNLNSLYGYAMQNPTLFTDPSGLAEVYDHAWRDITYNNPRYDKCMSDCKVENVLVIVSCATLGEAAGAFNVVSKIMSPVIGDTCFEIVQYLHCSHECTQCEMNELANVRSEMNQ